VLIFWLLLSAVLNAFPISNPPEASYVTYLPAISGRQVALDAAGFAYIAGVYFDSRYPCEFLSGYEGPSGPTSFVTKLKPGGDGAVWSVCLPGQSAAVAVDRAGFVIFAAGVNGSTSVFRLDPTNGKALPLVTLSASAPSSLAVDRTGNLFVTGAAGRAFAATPGAFRSESSCAAGQQDCTDAFAAKISANGTILYATFLASGAGNSIAVDSKGQAWIAGAGRAAATGRGGFALKLDSSGRNVVSAKSYPGGLAYRTPTSAEALGVSVDANDAAYVVGSTGLSITTTPGVIHPVRSSRYSPDGFLVKYDAQGNTVYATYLGSPLAVARAVALDGDGNAYFGVNTQIVLPHCGVFQSRLTVVNSDASRIVATSPLLGSVNALALDDTGGLVVAGDTRTTAFLATADAYINQYPGGPNAAIAARVDFTKPASPRLNCVVNGASLTAGRNRSGPDGSIAPGEFVSLFGEGFQPGPGLSVTFDGKKAPILYADSGQINAIVPFERTFHNPLARVSVWNGAQIAGSLNLPVAPAAPGFFRLDGRLAALNENGSIIRLPIPRRRIPWSCSS
jgi:hypothetical protein